MRSVPVEITVIDDGNVVGWLAAATRVGEISMTDVPSMVANVLTKAGGKKISRLNVLDHGNAKGLRIGKDWVSERTLGRYAAALKRLRGHFTGKGFVHFQACQVGQDHVLLGRLAKLLGVPVVAGTGYQNPIYRFNTGDYVKCNPNGACYVTARP
jgi:hypothetical protein